VVEKTEPNSPADPSKRKIHLSGIEETQERPPELVGTVLESTANDQIASKENSADKKDEFQAMVDQIWRTYDADRSESLDREETKKFVDSVMGNFGAQKMSDSVFIEVFKTMDKDNSGTIDKNELSDFLRKIMGGGGSAAKKQEEEKA